MSPDIMYYGIYTKQSRKYRFKLVLCFFASIILLATMIYAYVMVDSKNRVIYGDGETLMGWQYVSGYNLVNVNRALDFKTISSLSEISPKYEDLYVRLVKTLPASDELKYLHINTNYNQLEIKINGKTVYDSLDITTAFGASMNISVEVPANEDGSNIDIIVRSSFIPKLNVVLSNTNTVNSISMVVAITIFLLLLIGIFSFASVSRGLLIENKHLKTILVGIGGAECLYFGFFICYGLLSLSIVDSLLMLRICFLFGMAGTLMFVFTAINMFELEQSKKQAIMSIGVLYSTVFAISSRGDLFFFLIKNFGWLILGLFLSIFVYYFKSHPEKNSGWFNFGALSLLFVSILLFWLQISFGKAYFLIPVLLISFLIYNISSFLHAKAIQRKLNKKENIISKDYYNFIELKPKNLGAVGELLDVYLRDEDNFSHVTNVSKYVYLICYHSGMLPEVCETVSKAALLHDIGKLKVPHGVLKKQETLNADEYELMKKHALYGYQILSSDKSEFMQIAAIIAKQHHERYDGNGYYGLKADQIHPYAQITCIADVFDALISERGYKKAWSFDEGFEYIVEHSGICFSIQYVEAFIKAKEEIRWVYENTKVGKMPQEVI